MQKRLISACLLALIVTACEQAAETSRLQSAPEMGANMLVASCSGCHMPGGEALADISAYSEAQLAASLGFYKSDLDGTTVMHRLARGYTEEQISEIAEILGAPDT